MQSSSKTSTRKSMKSKVPRPINCFMAFRLDKYPIIAAQSPKLNHRDISKVVAKWWKEASVEEKKPYVDIALQKKAEHRKLHPNYKYEPIKKSDKHVRPYHRKENAAVLRRKAEANKELMKKWLGDDDNDSQSNDDNDSINEHCFLSSSQSPSSSASSLASMSPLTVPSSILFKDDFCLSGLPFYSDNQPILYDPLFDFDSGYNASQSMALDSFFIQPWMDVDPTLLNTANLPFFDYESYIDPQPCSSPNYSFMFSS